MLLYKKVLLPQFDTIVSELSRAIPESWIVAERGFVRFDHTVSPALVQALDQLGLVVNEEWIIVVPPNFSTQLHIDYFNPVPRFRSSLNIPLYNCGESLTEFYRCKGLGTEVKHNNTTQSDGIPFIRYELDQAELIDQYSLDTACILNTQVPHRVVNWGRSSRVCISLRFAREIGDLWL